MLNIALFKSNHGIAFVGSLAKIVSVFCLLMPLNGCIFSEFDHRDNYSMKEIFGTWKEEKGQPDNYVAFHIVERESSDKSKVYEGRVTFNKMAGYDHKDVVWNYSYWDPILILNVVEDYPGPKAFVRLLKAKALDHNHLLIKFEKNMDIKDINWLNASDTIKLTRTEEPNVTDLISTRGI